MATLSNILAWKIPWTEEPGELQSIGSQRVGQDLACMQEGSTNKPSSYRLSWASECFTSSQT